MTPNGAGPSRSIVMRFNLSNHHLRSGALHLCVNASRVALTLLYAILLALPAHAEEAVTSQNNPMMAWRLKNFPWADRDGDGVLTQDELRLHLEDVRAGRLPKQLQPTYEEVRYGPHGLQKLDLWKAPSDLPTPLLIYFHGGGFMGGSKQGIRSNPRLIQDCLNHGISLVSANYRLAPGNPFPTPMKDGARAIQYVRSRAIGWNVDPKRIAAMGTSAGANMAIWIAVQDDMAEPDNKHDPVLKLSTRLACVVAINGQTFNDPVRIRQEIGGDEMPRIAFQFFGFTSAEDFQTTAGRELCQQASAIDFVTPDDPPMLLSYNGELDATPLPAKTPLQKIIHHPRFGELFKQKMDAAGVECILGYREAPIRHEQIIEFLCDQLRLEPDLTAAKKN
ncbi:alpha/beta hydrolase [Candidatus Sumerlaeota bacterium]|nr:alpha/beta hydrolase [Candidatus Sumerlaeota bacterium]